MSSGCKGLQQNCSSFEPFVNVGAQLRDEALEQGRVAAQQTTALEELLRQAAEAPKLKASEDVSRAAAEDARLAAVLKHANMAAAYEVARGAEPATGNLASMRSQIEVPRLQDRVEAEQRNNALLATRESLQMEMTSMKDLFTEALVAVTAAAVFTSSFP